MSPRMMPRPTRRPPECKTAFDQSTNGDCGGGPGLTKSSFDRCATVFGALRKALMPQYSLHSGSDWRRPSLRQRATVLGLTLLVELAVLLLILAFKPREPVRVAPMAPTSISFVLSERPAATAAAAKRAVAKPAAKPVKTPPPRRAPPTPPMPSKALPFVPMSKADMAEGDISKHGSAAAPSSGAGAGQHAAFGPGEGPGGVQLYNAEWVVEPSNAQLATYLPRAVESGSWALIACKTIEHNHVENCAQLGESPLGSGLSRAMRLAAWQFLVRPPRIDGKPQVGAWVRIRIDFKGGGKDE